MLRSSNPESTVLLPDLQHTPHSWRTDFANEIEHDDAIWKEYLEAAHIADSRMLSEWNSFLDVILVFVRAFPPVAYRLLTVYMKIGLFIAILTSFAIETQKLFYPDQAKLTNEFLVYILNTLSNSSAVPKISLQDELDKITIPGSEDHRTAVILNTLLFVSLALAIVISMGAMARCRRLCSTPLPTTTRGSIPPHIIIININILNIRISPHATHTSNSRRTCLPTTRHRKSPRDSTRIIFRIQICLRRIRIWTGRLIRFSSSSSSSNSISIWVRCRANISNRTLIRITIFLPPTLGRRRRISTTPSN